MTQDKTTVTRVLGRITALISDVVSGAVSGDAQISGIILRISEAGMKVVLPDGRALTVQEDQVGKGIRRAYSLFAGRRLRVTCRINYSSGTIKLIKVETQHNSARSSKTWLSAV